MFLVFFYRVHFSFPCQTCVQENVGYMRIDADHPPCACPHYRVKCFSYHKLFFKNILSSTRNKPIIQELYRRRLRAGKRAYCSLTILEGYRLSSVPIFASPIHAAPSFRATVVGIIVLSTIKKLKGYADRNSAFSSFFITSATFSMIRIKIHY